MHGPSAHLLVGSSQQTTSLSCLHDTLKDKPDGGDGGVAVEETSGSGERTNLELDEE